MAAGDVILLHGFLRGAVRIEGVLDADGLISEVRRTVTGSVRMAGTITIDGRPYPLGGAMPIPVPKPQRFSPDVPVEVQFAGERS